MAVREIRVFPDPVLREKTKPIEEFGEPLEKLLEDMWDSMLTHDGVGLAGPQIGVSLRITVIQIKENRYVLINPEILEERGEQVDEEGCLSFPGIFEKVCRPEWVKVRALNERGEPYTVEGSGLLARALSHEINHLDGVLLIDHLSSLKRGMIKRRLKKRESSENT
jgi:peptide deformylase